VEGKHNYLFKVPNTEEGDLFRSLLKKFLNNKTYRFKRKGRDNIPIREVRAHRYYLFYKNDDNELEYLAANNCQFLLESRRRMHKELRSKIEVATRNMVKQLMRVCSDDEDLSDIAEKLERLYVAKTLLGEE